MMARWTVQSIIRGYHEYISKLLLESEFDLKILQYRYVSVPRSLRKTHLGSPHVAARASC